MLLKILSVKKHDSKKLIENLREVGMHTRPEVKPYADARIELATFQPRNIAPSQRYVYKPELEKVRDLRWALLEHGVDPFHLDGYVTMQVEGIDYPIDLLPPVIELSHEANDHLVPLLNDGMHRVFLALMSCANIQVVKIEGVPEEYPYYAYPWYNGWDGVEIVTELPDGYIKKWHRIPDNKSLYRDFNTSFQNVGGPRPATPAA